LLARILGIRAKRSSDVDARQDAHWHTMVTLGIGSHPGLSGAQKKVVALDYGMRGGEASVSVRKDAVRGIDADIRWSNEGSFHKDKLRDLRFDFILANPPFNVSDWGGERLREDARWQFGVPPVGYSHYSFGSV
jgi:hypothetical protein